MRISIPQYGDFCITLVTFFIGASDTLTIDLVDVAAASAGTLTTVGELVQGLLVGVIGAADATNGFGTALPTA